MRGRKPKPTALKIAQGNPGKRPLNVHEPRPTKGMPSCPAWLDAEAKAEWKRVAPDLHRMGMLTKIYRAELASFCVAWSMLVTATKHVKDNGITIITAKGFVVPNPALQVVSKSMNDIRSFGSNFGLDPAARTRLHAPDQGESDPLDDFLAGKKTGAG